MEPSIMRQQEPREAVTVTAHTWAGKILLWRAGLGRAGWAWGASGWRVCSALLPKAGLWTWDLPHLPHWDIPREGESLMAHSGLGFRTFES